MEIGMLILLIVGLACLIISAAMDSLQYCHEDSSMIFLGISITAFLLMFVVTVASESTPDVYVVRADKTREEHPIYLRSTYTLPDGTKIKLAKDSAYVINMSKILFEQETVVYCQDPDKVGTRIPEYSLDTLSNSILTYPKRNTIFFRKVYPEFDIDVHDSRDEVGITRIGIAGESDPAGNAYRRLTKSAADVATY